MGEIDLRRAQADMVAAALAAADPAGAVRRHLRRVDGWLIAGDERWNLAEIDRVFIVALGKAAPAMARAAAELIGDAIAGGVIVTNAGGETGGPLETIVGGHPIPDENSEWAGRRIAELLAQAGERDLVLCLLSGGGSALATLPVKGITLSDLRLVTDALLRSGATIDELNAVRKHLDEIKGGGIARLAGRSRILSLILSDVVGDRLDVIASGPTAPDPTTFEDAMYVFERRHFPTSLPPAVRLHLEAGVHGGVAETPKPDDPLFERVRNVIVGSNRMAAEAAAGRAVELGFNALVLTTFLEGEAREAGRLAAALAKELARADRPILKPACLVMGGETTVTVRGDGKGGRSQELALAAAAAIEGLSDVLIAAFGTDGIDGPTDAAGAIADGETCGRARALGLNPAAMLAYNDAYHFFAPLGDLIVTGPTGTNVNDLVLILAR